MSFPLALRRPPAVASCEKAAVVPSLHLSSLSTRLGQEQDRGGAGKDPWPKLRVPDLQMFHTLGAPVGLGGPRAAARTGQHPHKAPLRISRIFSVENAFSQGCKDSHTSFALGLNYFIMRNRENRPQASLSEGREACGTFCVLCRRCLSVSCPSLWPLFLCLLHL